MVVDDEPMMEDVFRIAFDGIYHVDGYLNGDEALEALALIPYPVAIVDLRMHGMNGVQLLVALKKLSPRIQVVILTGHACKDSAIAAVNSGAFRYLEKPFQLVPMRRAVADALARHAVDSDDASSLNPEALAELGLVGRKAEVALQVVRCKSTKEIATELKLSPRTVEKHLESVFALLGVTSRRELMAKLKSLIRHFFVMGSTLLTDDVILFFS